MRVTQTLTPSRNLRYCGTVRWTAQQKAEATTAMANSETLASVHHRTGIPRQTLSRWAKAASVDLGHTAEKTREAASARIAKAAHRRAGLVETLTTIAEKAAARELKLIEGAELREVVGARTRAIHDAELLSGQATERHEEVGAVQDEVLREAWERHGGLRAVS